MVVGASFKKCDMTNLLYIPNGIASLVALHLETEVPYWFYPSIQVSSACTHLVQLVLDVFQFPKLPDYSSARSRPEERVLPSLPSLNRVQPATPGAQHSIDARCFRNISRSNTGTLYLGCT